MVLLERDDEFKLLGFLASLAGLLGIVVSVSQFQAGLGNSKIVTAYFSILLVVFLLVSALTFLAALQGRDVTQLNMAVLGYFSGLLAVVVALAVATLSENYYVFWPIGVLLGSCSTWPYTDYTRTSNGPLQNNRTSRRGSSSGDWGHIGHQTVLVIQSQRMISNNGSAA